MTAPRGPDTSAEAGGEDVYPPASAESHTTDWRGDGTVGESPAAADERPAVEQSAPAAERAEPATPVAPPESPERAAPVATERAAPVATEPVAPAATSEPVAATATTPEEVRPRKTTDVNRMGVWARIALAVLRIALGFVFLWAFLDKCFGLNYSTSKDKAWINGGSPTKGFLGNVEVGPWTTFYHDIAGKQWADWAFMLALALLGVALILGIGLRLAAIGGTALMAMMWVAEWPLDKTTTDGKPTGSTNPIVDYHVIYALAIIVCALCYAGHTLGFGRPWSKLIKRQRWLV